MSASHILRMEGVSKAFPGVQALDNVDLAVRPGEVMALVGENGAGKSTLIKALAGVQAMDTGMVFIDDELQDITSPKRAQELGIAVIYQELALAEKLSVAENIFVGREPRNRAGLVDRGVLYRDTQALLDELQVDINPSHKVDRLSIAQKQMVEIARALSADARIMVMDEPTSSLPTATSSATENEVDVLLRLVDRLRSQGKAIIYISHRMKEIFRISDRITILRDGRQVGLVLTEDTDPDSIVTMMVGRKLEDLYGRSEEILAGEVVMSVRDLTRAGKHGPVSFDVRSGEILGVAGLIGAGRTDVALTLFGVFHADSGEVLINGKKQRIASPQDAVRAGIGYLPEDRKLQGLFLSKSVRSNISAAIPGRISRFGFLRGGADRVIAERYIKDLGIRTPSMEQRTHNLSGGNQQKVVLAKWLATEPKVLILDEPTRGVDVGAKAEIYALMRAAAGQGTAIVMISSELPEILGMSDRVVVMREGNVVGEVARSEATEESIMSLATGLQAEKGLI